MKAPSLLLVFGDIKFDGRAQRMLDIALSFGPVTVLDASTQALSEDDNSFHERVVLNANWGPAQRHLAFARKAIQLSRRLQPKIVFAENYLTIPSGWLAARISASKLIYDAYELIIPEAGITTTRRQKFWYAVEKYVANRAALIISANPERAQIISEHYLLNKSSLFMRNIPKRNAVTPEQVAEVMEIYPTISRRSKDEKIMIYQGDISIARGIDKIVKSLLYLPLNYRFLIVGEGPNFVEMKKLVEDFGLQNRVFFLGRVPHSQLPAISLCADIGVVTYPFQGLNNINCASNKLFEYTQAHLCVIGSNQTPIASVINEFQLGDTFTEQDNSEEIALKISGLRNRLTTLEVNNVSLAYNSDIESNRVIKSIDRLLHDS